MVKKPVTDIDGLFRSFGVEQHGYRELAREADAREAQQRWPMLGEIAPEAETQLTAVDTAHKQHWRQHAQAKAAGAVLPAPERGQESRRLATGLEGLLSRGPVSAQTPAAAVKRVVIGETRSVAAERSVRETGSGLFAKRPLSAAEKRPSPSPGGLFGRLGGKQEAASESRDNHSLSGLFARISGDKRRPDPPDRRRTGKR